MKSTSAFFKLLHLSSKPGPILFILFATTVSLQIQAADVAGSSDHPVVGRFSGSEIHGYKHYNFNEYEFAEGDVVRDENDEFVYSQSSIVEGEVTRIYYVAPAESSVAEVTRNYEKQLTKKGFKVVYSCKGNSYECGYWASYMSNFKPGLVDYPYNMSENRLVTLKKTDPGGDIYVSVLVFNYSFDFYPDRHNHPVIQLDVIEAEPLDDDQIEVVTAERIASEVTEQGRIAIYGIHFETGKSELEGDSLISIMQINEALQNKPDLNLHVVGHTDNQGTFDSNMQLSKDRANAVVKVLVGLGVDAGRLTANGVASLAPVASNNTEDGRAKNRRVELVAQ